MTIYSSALAMKALEEARWLNDVSKDPELSKLLHDVSCFVFYGGKYGLY